MSYPDLPNNRLIVNGVDLSERYGLILVDGYTLEPPEPKTYTVDIPGGNGVIDLTDAMNGEPVYDNRKQTFNLYAFGLHDEYQFEILKTDLSNFLHGKSYDYQLTMDRYLDYTSTDTKMEYKYYNYHGRFTITDYDHSDYDLGIVAIFKIEVDAEPYKWRETITEKINFSNGIFATFQSGRKKVQPKFQFPQNTIFVFNGVRYSASNGTYTYNDVWFEQGSNEVFFLPSSFKSNLRWGDFHKFTWGEAKTNARIFEWYNYFPSKRVVSSASLNVTGDVTGSITFNASDGNGNSCTSTMLLSETITESYETTEKEYVYYIGDVDTDTKSIADYCSLDTHYVDIEQDENGNDIIIKDYYIEDDGTIIFIGKNVLENVTVYKERDVIIDRSLMSGDIVEFYTDSSMIARNEVTEFDKDGVGFYNDLAVIKRYDSDGNDIGFILPCELPYSYEYKLSTLECDAAGSLLYSYGDLYDTWINAKWGYYSQNGMVDSFTIDTVDADGELYTDHEDRTINMESTWGSLSDLAWSTMSTTVLRANSEEYTNRNTAEACCYVQYVWGDL